MIATDLTVAIPTFAVMLGIIFNRQDSTALRAEMVALRDSIHRDMIMLHERVAILETKQDR